MRFLWKMILKEIWQRLSNLNSEIRRGDLYYADLSPVVGSEQGGVRPVLIIQNNIGYLVEKSGGKSGHYKAN